MRVVDFAPIRAELIRSIAGPFARVYGPVYFYQITGTYVDPQSNPFVLTPCGQDAVFRHIHGCYCSIQSQGHMDPLEWNPLGCFVTMWS
jgi:hypothetical protein